MAVRRKHERSALSTAIAGVIFIGGLATATANAQVSEPGRAGDAASWRTQEFSADWGLAAIRAEYAYARGLSGRGVRTGIFDSGTGLDHPEFAGKDHRSLQIADTLADGSRCTNTTFLSGPGACFSSRGDEVAVDYVGFHDSVPERIREIIRNGNYVQPGFTYGSHGTHVGGTIVANRDGQGRHGVAFGADLTTARLFFNTASQWQPDGEGYSVVRLGGVGPDISAFADMYQQMNQQSVRVINHSWGLPNNPDTVDQLDRLLRDPEWADYWNVITDGSRAGGLIQVWAAGNTDAATANPAASPFAGTHATLPRAFSDIEPYWLSVVNVNRDLVLSNRSHKCGLSMNWCVAAPGTDIRSTVYEGDENTVGELTTGADGSISLEVRTRLPAYGYANLNGTSMAAPHVTGALALLIERFPYLDNPQVRDVLLTTTTDLGAPGVDDIYGWGLVNLEKAIDGPGQIRVDTNVVMNQRAGGNKVWEGEAWDDWRNDIGGSGRLTKSGVGWLRLSGDNTFGGLDVRQGVLELDADNRLGDVEVNGGLFVLNGKLTSTDLLVNSGVASIQGRVAGGATRVAAGGSLHGIGTLGDTVVEGTIAPGNSIGTLRIEGTYTQAQDSVYEAEIAAPLASDRIDVSGRASLLGGTVRVFNAPGQYLLGQRFNVLTASDGVSGQFARIDASAISPFLKFDFNYGANEVDVDVARGMALAAAARTRNQRSVATSADVLPIDARLAQTLTQLFPQQALDALDSLSGELHASTQSVLVEGSRHVRDAALARARAGTGEFAAANGDAPSAAWIQALGSGGTLHADGNAGEVDYNGSTTLLGYDVRFDNGFRVGVLGGLGRDDVELRSRRSKGDINTRHLGLYAGQAWGGFGLRAGLGYATHDVDVERTIAFPGVQDRTRADYDADTRQAYIEGGYRLAAGAWEWEPYGQFAQVRTSSEGIAESGGVAALTGQVADSRANLSTLGLRFNLNLKGAGQQESALSLRGGVSRRHASGDLSSTASLAWQGGGAFDVHGAPLAENANLAEVGLGARVSRNGLVELNYSGQFADESRDQGVNARYTLNF
ncbi:autotransporter domain-containing protein [Lysobacter sp. S4-A87]|uniref:autotransporter domain-containing protein n=1 Tax=Lysobacter sp. S4-A87 TaxID=2925843 RepID=UPI001F533267|nr:autotransporter serine protease [Lysobacter sp. S4-A87]UNK49407.1 autotransporter domain-containing protein [Lysobacter sp. S4-A87]